MIPTFAHRSPSPLSFVSRAAGIACAVAFVASCALTPKDPIEAAKAEPGAVTVRGNIVVRDTQSGWGPSPHYDDRIKVKYRGYFPDGKEFDNSGDAGSEFILNAVIVCWTQALQQMKVGGKATITCPGNTAYGDKGIPNVIPPNATLRFDVELVSILSR